MTVIAITLVWINFIIIQVGIDQIPEDEKAIAIERIKENIK